MAIQGLAPRARTTDEKEGRPRGGPVGRVQLRIKNRRRWVTALEVQGKELVELYRGSDLVDEEGEGAL